MSIAMREAQQRWDNMLPEDVYGEEPPEPDYDRYVREWINGEIAEVAGQDIYAAPLERLTEDDCLVQLLKASNDEELLAAAKAVKGKLWEFVAEQAA